MIGGSTLATLIGSRPAGDKSDLKTYARALARAGLHLVLVEPDTKRPLDMRSAVAKRADDEAAQLAAKAAGNPRWSSVRAPAGVHLATDDTTKLDRYLTAAAKVYGPDAVNLGVEVGRSRLLVVDADTAESVNAFLTRAGANVPPTVSTPGKHKDGQWVHQHGGHWWFSLPDGVELPTGGTGAFTADGWTAYWSDRQLLIPPSTRPEGPYRWTGDVHFLPEWLYQLIAEQAAARKAKATQRIDAIDSPIDTWAARTSWAELLEPRGWTNTGRVSNCGCPEYTAPGLHDNPKSATAHDLGCSHEAYDGAAGHSPLHVWTDNPPPEIAAYVSSSGTRTMSKMQFVAWTDHGGDLDQACRAYSIPHSSVVDPWNGQLAALSVFSADDIALRDQLVIERQQSEAPQHFSSDVADPEPRDDVNPIAAWFHTHAGPWSKFQTLPAVQFLVDGYLDVASMSMMIGERGVGKSFISLDMAASIALGIPWQGRATVQGRVAYMVGEGLHGFAERIRAWEAEHDVDLSSALYLIDEPVQVTDREMWNGLGWWCVENDISVLVLDTLNRISVGVDENSAQDMGRVVDAMRQVQQFAGCHVQVVHHTSRGTTHGRGSTALEGAADTVLLVESASQSETGLSRMQLSVTKMKNHAEPADMLFALRPEDNGPSAVVVAADGTMVTSSDPFMQLPPMPLTDEDRVQAVVDVLVDVPESGGTRAFILRQVDPSRISHRPLSKVAFERVVISAVDRALASRRIVGLTLASGAESTSTFVVA